MDSLIERHTWWRQWALDGGHSALFQYLSEAASALQAAAQREKVLREALEGALRLVKQYAPNGIERSARYKIARQALSVQPEDGSKVTPTLAQEGRT